MANNIVVRGLIASLKLITRGYGQASAYGIKVRFCRVTAKDYLQMKVSAE